MFYSFLNSQGVLKLGGIIQNPFLKSSKKTIETTMTEFIY